MLKPERCEKCGAEPEVRKVCPRCGEAEWILQHGDHYMQGAREVIGCSCPSSHSALGRRKEAIAERQAARVKAGKRADWNRPVTTPAMAKKAAEVWRADYPSGGRFWKPGSPSVLPTRVPMPSTR